MKIGRSEKEFQKRSFRWYVPCVPRYVPFCLRNRKGIPPRNFEMKRPKRSEKERDERSLLRVPGPCSQVRPFLLAELKRDTPRNFEMKRLIRNAFSERPRKEPTCDKFVICFLWISRHPTLDLLLGDLEFAVVAGPPEGKQPHKTKLEPRF